MTTNDSYAVIRKELSSKNVALVAVSKLQSTKKIMDLYAFGQRDFGENYVQELVEKESLLPKDIHWHFIGHLQRNKVKYIAPFVHLIQSVDSEKLLKEIDKEAAKNNRVINCLLQVHIAEEETKFGFTEDELEKFFLNNEKIYKNIKLAGLMGMGSLSDDNEKVKTEFKRLSTLFKNYFEKDRTDNSFLSMGMSSDYKIAIEEGSNMVRIGSLIFGSRLQ
ncbi:MAG: YggS family pyridoxal phosphate-dependent enzyme [Ginsengibacter sp.]